MPRIADVLDSLQSSFGPVAPHAPTDPYEFLVWWHCGYPASQQRCAKGWEAVRRDIGVAPEQLALASKATLVKALKAGGMVPELRAARLKEIAARVRREFSGDLLSALSRLSAPQVRRVLKSFPGIGNPGADRIALFSRLSPVAAVPSACPHVLVRIFDGPAGDKYAATYAAAQSLLEALPAAFDARIRGYLLIDRHGHDLCKRAKPLCARCPLQSRCAFANLSRKPQ